MNSVNPALASAVQASYLQANGLNNPSANEPKVQDKTTAQTSAGENTTVTLSSKTNSVQPDYSDLAVSQTVNNRDSVENANISQQETSSKTTYAGNLQTQSNFYANELTENSEQK